MAKIILRLPTNDEAQYKRVIKQFEEETVVVSEEMKILIKNESGYWKEVGRKRFKIGELEVED